MALQSLFNNQSTQNKSVIPGVTFNRPTGFVDQYGGNGELTGTSNWGSYFTGLEGLGEGYNVEDVQSIGGANPTGFTINRADPNGNANVYQQRQVTVNPDGTLSWANDNWTSKTQQSQMGHFLEAGLPMALAMAGGISALGSGAGAGAGSIGANATGHGAWLGEGAAAAGGTGAAASGGAGGLGSMYSLGGTEVAGSGLLAGTGTTGLQAAAGPGLSLAAPTGTGMGLSVPGAATAAGGIGAMDVLKGLGKALIGGQAGGISGLGNLASLFTNYKQYSNTGDLMDEIKSIYSPDGVYAKELEKQLARRDAAAGRNSQYGPRLAELMARLGDSQARSLSGLGGMMSTQQGGLNGMVGAGSRLLESTGALERLFSIFGD